MVLFLFLFLHQFDTLGLDFLGDFAMLDNTPLPAGIYTAAQLHATNATAFPLTFLALSGAPATSAAGVIKVGNVVVPPLSPRITSIRLSGTALNLSATNGTPGGFWALLQSTNVVLPLIQWQTNTTGTFDGSGNLSTNLANAVTSGSGSVAAVLTKTLYLTRFPLMSNAA